MPEPLLIVALSLLVPMLATCSLSVSEGLGHRITFAANGMLVHAFGHPDAWVSRHGDLSIDGKPVALTPPQRQLLRGYYAQAQAMREVGKATIAQETAIVKRRVETAIASFFHGSPSATDAPLSARSKRVADAAATTLCTDIRKLGLTQTAIAASLPAFAPYADGAVTRCGAGRRAAVANRAAPTAQTGHRPDAR